MFVLWKYNLSILEALQLWFTLKTLFDSILLTRTHSFCMDIQIHRTLNTSQWKEIVHQCVCVCDCFCAFYFSVPLCVIMGIVKGVWGVCVGTCVSISPVLYVCVLNVS